MAQRPKIQVSVLKKLFALSRNHCAFPSCEETLAKPEWHGVQCEVAHIYGRSPGSARYIGEADDSFENLILLCPNHHNLVDYLEPDRFDAETLLDWKKAIEEREYVGRNLMEADDDRVVREIARRSNLLIIGSQPDPIRSDQTDTPTQPTPKQRTSRRKQKIRVSELANELGMTNAELIELTDKLGVPTKSPNSPIQEAYADMVRRRAARDGLIREEVPPEPDEASAGVE